MSIRFSIIIPVYNVEKYLDKCLESILSQEFGNFEIICVDDCSTDNSWNMLEKYAEKDKRIRIFQQEKNAGQGVARNRALDLAQGEYILFVDPDDWIEKNSLSILDEELKRTKAQVLLFGNYNYEDFTGKIEQDKGIQNLISKLPNKSRKRNHFAWKEIKEHVLTSFVTIWEKCYEREYLIENNVYFLSTRIGEDQFFAHQIALSAKKIFFIEKYLYYYRKRKNSSVTTYSDENFCVFENINRTKELLIKKGIYQDLIKSFSLYKIGALSSAYHRLPLASREKFCREVKQILQTKEYKKFLSRIRVSPLEKIFSIRNKRIDGTKYKVICIFGLEFVLPNKKKKQRRDR